MHARCGAKTRQRDADGNPIPCKNRPVKGARRCRMHNPGKHMRGALNPQFKNGDYSDHLPTRLLQTYQQVSTDPELLNLSTEVSLLRTRLIDVLRRVDTGESGRLWQDLKQVYRDIEQAQRDKDPVRIGQLMGDLGNLIARGHADWAAWSSVLEISERIGRMSEREMKRRVQMHAVMTQEQGATLSLALLDAVRRHEDDRGKLARIAEEFDRIMLGYDQQRVAGIGEGHAAD
jgi:hypothetical protein